MILNKLALNVLRDRYVASVFPTTKRTVVKICGAIDFKKDIVIVEYGPGTGVFTEYLLSKMNENSKLIAIEKNKKLALFLENNFKDSRFKVFDDSAENVKRILKGKAHYVISGIPLSFFSFPAKEKLMKDTYDILEENGEFLIYQFSKKSKDLIEKYFNNVSSYSQIFNIPPLFVFRAKVDL